MPLIPYVCNDCKSVCKKMLRRAPFPSTLICDKCDGSMTRQLATPTQSSKITVDNGFQARAVEITPDIVEINEERSTKNLRED